MPILFKLLLLLIVIHWNCRPSIKIVSEIEQALTTVDGALDSIGTNAYVRRYHLSDDHELITDSLLQRIRSTNNRDKVQAALLIIDRIEHVTNKVDEISSRLNSAYNMDDQGKMNHKRDKSHVNRIMITESSGDQLERVIRESSSEISTILDDLHMDQEPSLIQLQNMLVERADLSWAEYNFQDMPVVAVVPILKKIKNDVTLVKIELLITLCEQH